MRKSNTLVFAAIVGVSCALASAILTRLFPGPISNLGWRIIITVGVLIVAAYGIGQCITADRKKHAKRMALLGTTLAEDLPDKFRFTVEPDDKLNGEVVERAKDSCLVAFSPVPHGRAFRAWVKEIVDGIEPEYFSDKKCRVQFVPPREYPLSTERKDEPPPPRYIH